MALLVGNDMVNLSLSVIRRTQTIIEVTTSNQGGAAIVLSYKFDKNFH